MSLSSPWRWIFCGALAAGASGWLVRSTDAFPMAQPVARSIVAAGAVSTSRRFAFGLYVQSAAAAASSSSDSRMDRTPSSSAATAISTGIHIDYQRDHGRGIHHLTADLAEGDVVVYQTGTWYVDGVVVGNGQEAAWEYCLVDNLQIVWSHNCEHGVVRGFALRQGGRQLEADWNDAVDFGPEQLVARLSVTAVEGEEEEGVFRASCELSDDLWRVEDETSLRRPLDVRTTKYHPDTTTPAKAIIRRTTNHTVFLTEDTREQVTDSHRSLDETTKSGHGESRWHPSS